MTAEYESLTVSEKNAVAEITLCRPELLNRFDAVGEAELAAVLREIARDDGVRAVVLLAEGRAFSAGGDFDLMLEVNVDLPARQAALQRARDLLDAITHLPQPMVVGVQGAAIGLGATVPLGSDAVVASRNATIADTHVGIALVAGDGGALFWPQSAGMLRARRHLLTGDPLDAAKAYEFGLVTDLVDTPDDVAPKAREIAGRIAALAPLAVQGTKAALNQLTRQRAGEVLETALLAEGVTLGSADLVEAIAAFKEKRSGAYVGR
ncbi:enoyl-CoA hydratase/isomerase family protein [Amycolatopsis acidicola]|uniref:Enoyl-CoA hydratase/isomerase family protein n=1 Tax=Amycolatopsis acidicola TaxID=2596893 RepID=A0A5N0V554_9PSEU|nr:enoyl-CoA hydratase-related protein [Amycolatopsis acidicola]KAA9160508.1 enoyl-CoA hydratase/isomerase family protein [Amycolatopsis acidicola]